MADPVLHIKDSIYFEVPRILWAPKRGEIADFPHHWIRLDDQFQAWEAARIHEGLAPLAGQHGVELPPLDELGGRWRQWQQEEGNFAKPLHVYLEEPLRALQLAWRDAEGRPGVEPSLEQFLLAQHPEPWFVELWDAEDFQSQWRQVRDGSRDGEAIGEFAREHQWSEAKLAGYNDALAGKVLIPQPFGSPRNLYQRESGLVITKFMVLELVAALLIVAIFVGVSRRLRTGDPPRGRFWNLVEVLLLFLRDRVARPAIGRHHADRFVPYLWTMFFFVLFCNVIGMIPWMGTATTSFAVTGTLALCTFAVVVTAGMREFGFVGFFQNLVPSAPLPLLMAIPIKSMLFLIEGLGLLIKHAVLAIRLLANMTAGHLVILGIMSIAFSLEAVRDLALWQWWLAAVISATATILFNVLELFIAVLQAYIFTFLSALFIGAAVHRH